MRPYAEVPSVRVRQVLTDALVALWVFVWVRIGQRIFELVDRLQAPGRSLEGAGDALSERASDLGDDVGGLPVIGRALRAPFRAIGDGGALLQEAGLAQQAAVHTLALWLGVSIAVIPIALLLLRYLPGRISWMREAAAGERVRSASPDLGLFALRALTNQPVSALAAVSGDPLGAYRRGEYAELAALELRRMGLRA